VCANKKMTGMFPRWVFAVLAFVLLCAGSAAAQTPASAAILERAEALQNRLDVWQKTLNEMAFGEFWPPDLSPSNRRGMCLEWIKTIFLSSLTSFDNTLLYLNDALKLARAMKGSAGGQAALEQDQQPVGIACP
jgi:hypothetical protein